MSVLPFPALSVEQVTLGNLPGAQDPDMVSVEEVRVSVALMPLLTGNVQVTEISLIDPVISIETFEDGSNNLVFDPAQAAPAGRMPARLPHRHPHPRHRMVNRRHPMHNRAEATPDHPILPARSRLTVWKSKMRQSFITHRAARSGLRG